MSYGDFLAVVASGRKNVSTVAGERHAGVRRPIQNVACYMDDLYVYLRARGEDAVGRVRPAKREDKPDACAAGGGFLHRASADRGAATRRQCDACPAVRSSKERTAMTNAALRRWPLMHVWRRRHDLHDMIGRGRRSRTARDLSIELVDPNVLRVCADPHNLPFSNEKGEGFENKLAELFAEKLSKKLAYTWFPQATGFVRNTLGAHRCDVIMGFPQGDDLAQSTNPYYRTAYALVFKAGSGLDGVTTLADARLKDKRIGIVAGTPPATNHGGQRPDDECQAISS